MQHQRSSTATWDALLARAGALFDKVCAINDNITLPFVSKFQSATVPDVSVYDYLSHLVKHLNLSQSDVIGAVILINRVQERTNHYLIIQSINVHRLVLTGLLLTTKFLHDTNRAVNKAFATVGGISLQELNELEVEFLIATRYDVSIPVSTFQSVWFQLLQDVKRITLDISSPSSATASMNSTPSSTETEQQQQQQQQQQKQGQQQRQQEQEDDCSDMDDESSPVALSGARLYHER